MQQLAHVEGIDASLADAKGRPPSRCTGFSVKQRGLRVLAAHAKQPHVIFVASQGVVGGSQFDVAMRPVLAYVDAIAHC